MGDQTKKISFGFSKLAKKTAIVSTNLNKTKEDDDGVSKVEFIDCLEGKSIKLKDPVKLDQGPLIIPLTRTKEEKGLNHQINSENVESKCVNKGLQNNPANESSETSNEETAKSDKTGEINTNDCQNKHETLDEIAAREILEELNRKKAEDEQNRVFSVPLTSNAPSGEKESTLEDYDNVPVGDFGLAMLRGMGWAPGKGIGKTEKLVAPTLPTLRPKGMGLGADKVMKSVEKKNSNEELKMVKGSFIRVLAGSEKDAYGQIEGFDDESGRLFVKLALRNDSISLNEFMVQLVDANEFKKNSKVINVSKYERYKEDEVKKESSERRLKEDVHENKHGREPSSPYRSEKSDDKPKVFNKNRSSSYVSEERNLKDCRTKSDLPVPKSRSDRSPSRSSRSPSNRGRIKERSQPRGHSYNSAKHEAISRHHYKSLTSDDMKRRTHSSDSSGSSSSYRITTKKQSSGSSKTKSSVKDKSVSRQRSSSNSSTSASSGDYSRKKKNKPNKKKRSSSNKYRSRSRSRSPRKHKHKKSVTRH